ncbi:MAG TPA: hypothetical protein GX743_05815 [Actinomycetales bacterium]|nr:hypothetical protein [Actinomycetales bacterium]
MNTTNPQKSSPTRTRWGTTRIGGRSIHALAVAIPLGLLVSLGIAFAVQYWADIHENPLVEIGVVTMAVAPAALGLAYVLVVDRETILGASARPERSVESTWFQQAAAGSYTDLLFVTGIGAAVAAFTRWEAEVSIVLVGVILFAWVSFIIRYLVIKARS